jgi:hypothetical protein
MRKATAVAVTVLAIGVATPAAAAPAAGHPTHPNHPSLARLRAVTARYHDVRVAVAAGFVPTTQCVPGMGYHYVNPTRVADGMIDPDKPEILLYVPTAHGVRLAGVEYMKIDADQNPATDDDRPSVFGRRFEGPMLGHGPGQPVHYDKHLWIWRYNPRGTFAPENPKVRCT